MLRLKRRKSKPPPMPPPPMLPPPDKYDDSGVHEKLDALADHNSRVAAPALSQHLETLDKVQQQVQQVQAEHADRIARLERRHEDDARMKSVWGAGSPFPSVLSGTPQQGM